MGRLTRAVRRIKIRHKLLRWLVLPVLLGLGNRRLRSPFFCDIARCHSVFGIRHFETAWLSHLCSRWRRRDHHTVSKRQLQLPSDTAPHPCKREAPAAECFAFSKHITLNYLPRSSRLYYRTSYEDLTLNDCVLPRSELRASAMLLLISGT
jgi:hypothetical protein